MLLWLGAGALAATGPGGYGDDSVATLVDAPEVTDHVEWHGVLAQSSGDVGGMVLAAVTLLVLGLGGVAMWRADLSSLLSRSGSTSEGTGRTETPTDPNVDADAGPRSPEQTVESEGTSGPPQPEALTDRERVVQILDDNEGRMKQARIVDETGWSKSKVSMLLSEMENDEEISKLRVGRENIISLSGNEPEAAGSPFEDE